MGATPASWATSVILTLPVARRRRRLFAFVEDTVRKRLKILRLLYPGSALMVALSSPRAKKQEIFGG
jgi:hypothetical protein